MNTKTLFSSSKMDWGTPPEILSRFGPFDIDAAANAANAVCPRWFGPGGEREDALSPEPWPVGRIWLNPPYGRTQKAFVERAYQECLFREGDITLLLPARTDTALFHTYIWDRETQDPRKHVLGLHFLKGRLTFVGAPDPAPFPSMVVVFG